MIVYVYINRVIEGYYSPTVLQYQFEVENGRTPNGEVLRFGFDENSFPGFSDKGYAKFSYAQVCLPDIT